MQERVHIKINTEYFKKQEKTQIITLGGLSQIGLNITLIETPNTLIAVDCGMAFPNENYGIDKFVPDVKYIKKKISKFKGFFITHGHEDHIGGLSYALQQIGTNIDIYGLEFSCELIKKKLIADGYVDTKMIHIINPNEEIKINDIVLKFIRMSHSIPDSAAIYIKTPSGNIFFTGDFKIDMSAEKRNMIDLNEIESIQKDHIHLMLTDSTNSEKPGWTDPEKRIRNNLYNLISSNANKRIIISTFSSNINRIEGILNIAEKLNRPVIIDGKSLLGTLMTAKEKKCISFNENNIYDAINRDVINQKNAVILVTGSQGENTAVLARMSRGEHPTIRLKPDDMIIFSSKTIPGNEADMETLLNNLVNSGVKYIVKNIHTSGHANAEELKLIARLVHPDYILPIHGNDYQRLIACKTFAKVGYKEDQLIMGYEGAVYELVNGTIKKMGDIPVNHIMIENYGETNSEIIEERKRLSTEGIILIIINEKIKIESIGLTLSEKTKEYLLSKINQYLSNKTENNILIDKISEDIYAIKGKKPIIKIIKGESHHE